MYICKDEIIAVANISKRTFHKIIKENDLEIKCGYSPSELLLIYDSLDKKHIKRYELKQAIKGLIK